MTDEVDELGPIGYLVVEFPTDNPDGEVLSMLVDLADRDIIRILDLNFIVKAADGTFAGATIADFDGDGALDLAVFEGSASGLIAADDHNEVGAALDPGMAAAILVYENRWAAPFVSALRRKGARLIADGRIPLEALAARLDQLDAGA